MICASYWMLRNAQRAIFTTSALRLRLTLSPSCHCIVVAWGAVISGTACAYKQGYRAAEHALPVNELIPMQFAISSTETCFLRFFSNAFTAQQLFFLDIFISHCLRTVLQSSKVGLFALETLIEGASVHRKFFQFSKIEVTWINNSSFLIQSFFLSNLNCELLHLLFKFLLFLQLC